jgi:7-carboxy-7-deazaguanine synthase
MSYRVKELFYTLQGEGTHAGRPAVFCRFTGCNLWSGRESDRASAVCQFCDTDFTPRGAMRYEHADDLAEAVTDLLPENAWDDRTPMIVLTGGEPMLQVDADLISTLLAVPLYVAIETNGTKEIPFWLNWVCVSPKSGATLVVNRADEVKLVYPQPACTPGQIEALIEADSYRLQPMDGPELEANTAAAVDYCLAHPQWSLSVQTHKMIGVR